jgi:hypothetical protein
MLLLFVAALAARAGADDLASDARALLAFRDAVGRRLTWNASDVAGACSWTGVSCENGRVAVLRLPGATLSGAVPAGTLGNLTALHTLSLRLNGLSGALPADLASAAALRNVFLNGNRLSGGFPQAILALPALVRLSLGGNDLSGPIPAELGSLTHLRVLLLENNRFSGEISDVKLPPLQQFNVSFNQLNGSIPASLRSQPRSAFLGTGLCGGPLGPCPGEVSPSPAPAGQTPSLTPVPSGGGGNGSGSGSGGTIGGNGGESGHKNKKLSGGAIAGIAIGSALGAGLLLFLLVCLCRRSGGTRTRSLEMPPPEAPAAAAAAGGRKPPEMTSGAAVAPLTTIGHPNAPIGQSTSGKKLVFFGSAAAVAPFDLEDLLRASAEVLGKGAFGTTYKAVLESGATVAVKRLKDVTLSEAEFRERISEIGELQHEFIVPLRAYYYSKDEKLLVYDFMPMGSLSAVLHGEILTPHPPGFCCILSVYASSITILLYVCL